jgi:hypothetical protein
MIKSKVGARYAVPSFHGAMDKPGRSITFVVHPDDFVYFKRACERNHLSMGILLRMLVHLVTSRKVVVHEGQLVRNQLSYWGDAYIKTGAVPDEKDPVREMHPVGVDIERLEVRVEEAAV